MSTKRMETFILKVLNSPPNIVILEKILKAKFAIEEFKTFSLEFPIRQEESYGFIDIFGLGRIKQDFSYIFIETKSKFSGAKRQAVEDLREYSLSHSKFGFFSDNMTKLYHNAVFSANNHTYNSEIKEKFLPLIVYPSMIQEVSNYRFEKMVTNYAMFIGNRISRRVPWLSGVVKTLIEDKLVPKYPNLIRKKDETSLVFHCFDFEGNKIDRIMSVNSFDLVPFMENSELNNKDLFDILSKVKNEKKKFVLQYSLNGYHKPNLFLEIQHGKFLCFQHIGLGRLNYVGTYDENAAFDFKNSLIYSTILVEKGEYKIINNKNQIIDAYLNANKFHGNLRLSFGASLSFSSNFKFEKMSTLTRF